MREQILKQLIELSRALGAPEADYTILAEGNTSARLDGDTFLLKASGFSLGSAEAGSFVAMRTGAVLELLEKALGDAELRDALEECRAGDGPRPSVEAALHALALTSGRATFVGHTHPTAVNAILCSQRAEAIAGGALFPDQVVVCGRRPLFVPYADPGIPLALLVRDRLREHVERYGLPPRIVYLENHGLIALGRSPVEVLQVTAMAVKAARVLLGAIAAGGPRYLTDQAAARIEARPDEHYRQAILGLK